MPRPRITALLDQFEELGFPEVTVFIDAERGVHVIDQ
jgi:hypothetical protein